VLGLKLFAIAAVAGLALGATNALTEGPIHEQEIVAADAARREVLPGADSFTELTAAGGLSEATRVTTQTVSSSARPARS
jgi:Na+-translocating ferredoxin:NAD+ oxidoreductase RnfG subunit